MLHRIPTLQNTVGKNFPILQIFIQNLTHSSKTNNVFTKPLIYPNTIHLKNMRPFFSSVKKFQETISPIQIKKRPVRKKLTLVDEESKQPGIYNVVAYSTADEYNLEALHQGLELKDLYEFTKIDKLPNILLAVGKPQEYCQEPSEIFFFREGSVVFWNVTDLEALHIISSLKFYEQDRYMEKFIQSEVEVMKYRHQIDGKSLIIQNTGEICIAPRDNTLEKYAFSNSMVASVKLGIWEATLDKFIDSIEYVTEDLKRGAKIKMSIEEVLTKHGELYSLRHLINLSSDLLDTPDFYWEHEELEQLYLQGYSYFSIGRRTKVINEKINHCIELIELLSRHLSDRHHIRLEWMVIGLIMAEVGFEIIHYIERYIS